MGAVSLQRKDELIAVVAVFSRHGLRSQEFPDLMVEKKVAESFELLMSSRTLVQLYLVAFFHCFILKPLMALMRADKQCCDLMGRMAGIPRRMLAVHRRGIFVGGKLSSRLTCGHRFHRTNGAECKLCNWSVCLLNPKCNGKVSCMLGDGWDWPVLSRRFCHLDGHVRDSPCWLLVCVCHCWLTSRIPSGGRSMLSAFSKLQS